MDALNERPLKVGKTDGFALKSPKWFKGEPITINQVTPDDKIQIEAVSVTTDRIDVLATGLEIGIATVKLEYETPTRKDSFTMGIKVIEP